MPDIIQSLKKRLKKADTTERCGLVLANGDIIEVENTHDDPTKGFKITAQALMDCEDSMVATWHTHPNDTANLSQEDYAGFLQWPSLVHYIIGVDGVRCFEVASGLVVEVSK